MKLCRIRPSNLMAFGLGFLLGSRSGPGAWNAVMEKWEHYQSRSGHGYDGNGHGQPATGAHTVDARDKAAPFPET